MASYKRRLIPIVDQAFQLKYTALIMGVAAVISTALGYFLLSAYQEMNSLIEISSEIGEQLNSDDADRVFLMVVGFLGAEVVILGFLGIIITHRVVGPVYVLHRHLDTILAGKYPTLRPLRAGDEFSSTFGVFAKAIAALQDRDKSEIAVLAQAIDAATKSGVDQATVDALRALMREREARLVPDDKKG
jgi:hypothetical protein